MCLGIIFWKSEILSMRQSGGNVSEPTWNQVKEGNVFGGSPEVIEFWTRVLSPVIKWNLHGDVATNPIRPVCFPGCCRLLLCVLCFSSARPCSPSPCWTDGRTSCRRSLVSFLITDALLFSTALLGGNNLLHLLFVCLFVLHTALHAEAPGIERYERFIINHKNDV